MHTAIKPLQFGNDTANRLEIDPSFAHTIGADTGPRLNARYQFEADDAKPAVKEKRNKDGEITTPAQPATPATVTTLRERLVYLTLKQWNEWDAGADSGDEAYLLECALENLGLTAA